MKIRIKGNSLRIRLTRSEVEKLLTDGLLEEQTPFGKNVLQYALKTSTSADQLTADFVDNKITMYVPCSLIEGWDENDTVGFEANMPLPGSGSLYLLLEKDFACMSEVTEDQSDNFENPNKNC